MAQHDYVIANGTGAAVRSDLNNALAAIVSNNSGATEPATMYAYQWWADTSTGLLKLRNAANNAWITLRELDGTLTIEDGSASSPGLAFADDLNTGIYSPGADQVAFTAGGTARLTATTTAVTSALPVDVPLGSASAPTVTFTGDLNTGIYSPGADQVAISTNGSGRLFVTDTRLRLNVGSQFHISNNTDASSGLQFIGSDSAESVIGTMGNHALTFRTNSVERMRLTSTGLGIGTSTPGELVHVYNSAATSRLIVGPNGTGAATPNALALEHDNTGYTVAHVRNIYNNAGLAELRLGGYGFTTFTSGSSQTERARIDSSGRLLVGTSTSNSNTNSKFQIADTSSNVITASYSANNSSSGYYYFFKNRGASVDSHTVLQSGDGIANLWFAGSDGSTYRGAASIEAVADGGWSSGDAPGRLVFSVTADGSASPTEAMRLENTGTMRVSGSIYRDGSCGVRFSGSSLLPMNSTGGNSDNGIDLGNGGQRWRTVYAGTGTINTSDANLKQDIEDLDQAELNVASTIKKLIKKFRFIDAVDAKGDKARIHVGVIAQEVEQAFADEGLDPRRYGLFCEDTLEDGSKRLGIRYDELLAFVIAAT